MKNILKTIILCTTMLNSFNVFSNPYVEVGGSMSYLNSVQYEDKNIKGQTEATKDIPAITLGAGYDFGSSRLSLDFTHYFMINFKGDLYDNSEEYRNNHARMYHRTKTTATFISFYKDLDNIGNFTPFLGGGVGVAKRKEKTTSFAFDNENMYGLINPNYHGKTRYNFAYKGVLGLSYKMQDNLTVGMSYNYVDLGKNKIKTIKDYSDFSKRECVVHSGAVFLRYHFKSYGKLYETYRANTF